MLTREKKKKLAIIAQLCFEGKLMDVQIWFTYMLHLANGRSENSGGEYSNVVGIIQGSSARLVLPAILGERRAWREIQNLYMRFVILKVRN